MALTSTITLEIVSVPLASSLVETRKGWWWGGGGGGGGGGRGTNNASDKTEEMIQWCSLERRCPCWCLNVILGKNHPVIASVHDAKMLSSPVLTFSNSKPVLRSCHLRR